MSRFYFLRGSMIAGLLLLTLTFIGCGNSDNFVFTNSPGTPTGPTATGLVFQTTPLRTAGQTFNAINVAVVDQDGAVVAGATNEITIALANPNGATLSGTLTRNAVNGVATFDNLSVDLAGNYTFIATSPGLDSAQSVAFVVTPDVATQVAFVQQPTDIKVGASFDPQVTL
ncbi:MAG: carboxypeptidase-like regulatory domain-containing protein, partial [Vulcanimicrobiota bacterium]